MLPDTSNPNVVIQPEDPHEVLVMRYVPLRSVALFVVPIVGQVNLVNLSCFFVFTNFEKPPYCQFSSWVILRLTADVMS